MIRPGDSGAISSEHDRRVAGIGVRSRFLLVATKPARRVAPQERQGETAGTRPDQQLQRNAVGKSRNQRQKRRVEQRANPKKEHHKLRNDELREYEKQSDQPPR